MGLSRPRALAASGGGAPAAEILGIAIGVLLLVTTLRAWLPSVITIYGHAGVTPARELGLFALAWFAGALLAIPAAWLVGADRLAVAAALATAFAILGAGTAVEGGKRQLYLLCAALLAGLVWLVCAAMTVRSGRWPAIGITLGLGLAVALHAALGTLDLLWRTGPLPAVVHATLGCVFVGCVAAGTNWTPAAGRAAAGARGTVWLLAGPSVLITGVVTGSTARAEAAAGLPDGYGAWIVAAGALLAPVLAARPRLSRHPAIPGAALLVAVAGATLVQFRIDGIDGLAPSWTAGWQAAGALAVGAVLGWVGSGSDARAATTGGDRPLHRGAAACGGVVLLVVLILAYYAPYDADLGYPNAVVPLASAAILAWAAVAVGPKARRWGAPAGQPRLAGWLAAAGVAGVAALGAVQFAGLPRPVEAVAADFPVRLVSYNIGMGFGAAGRFDPDGIADAIRRERPDVVVLSEVDRGWFVTGGHDDLGLLARRLGMRAVFAPAADPVWGDAMLTRLPVVSVRSERLPRAGAAMGAQALAAVLRVGERELGVIATHLQSPPGSTPQSQAKALSRIARELASHERPVVVAGDLHLAPGTSAFAALLENGLLDGLAAARPLPTYPAARPREELDHVLTTADLATSDISAPAVGASDHRPVAVTLTLHDPEALRPAP